jgi:curved DNA-binding protein CbpA
MNDLMRTDGPLQHPYLELGVDKKATTEQIRKAYRREAAKHHPDKGGDPAKWERIRLAHEILTDPKLRNIYDETGRIEEAKPDNDRAVALGVIESHIAAIMNKFLTDGMRPEFDPRKMDVPDVVAHRIRGEIRDAKVGLTGGKKVVAFIKDMVDRFRPATDVDADTCPIRRSFRSQIEDNEAQLRDLDKAIVVRELALKILAGYKFRQDENPPLVLPKGWDWEGANFSEILGDR